MFTCDVCNSLSTLPRHVDFNEIFTFSCWSTVVFNSRHSYILSARWQCESMGRSMAFHCAALVIRLMHLYSIYLMNRLHCGEVQFDISSIGNYVPFTGEGVGSD